MSRDTGTRDGGLPERIDGTRRHLLRLGAAGALGSAGCLAGGFPATEGGTPSGTPQSIDADRGTVSYTHEVSEAGRVSAAVYDSEGRLVRTLARGEERDPGEHTLRWDGLDRDGEPQDPDEYTIKTLRTPKFEAEFITQLGVNPDSGDHHIWIGNHNRPPGGAIAVDGDDVFFGTPNEEIVPATLKQSLDGTERHWTIPGLEPWTGATGFAIDGDTLYLLQPNARIRVIDLPAMEELAAETDRDDNWVREGPRGFRDKGALIDTWDVLPEGVDAGDNRRGLHVFADVTMAGSNVVVAFEGARHASAAGTNTVQWLDGAGSTVASADVESPAGVTATPSGAVLVGAATGVIEVARNGGQRPVVEGFEAGPIAFDAANDHVLVVDRDTRQVKRYSRDGELIDTYGTDGGRTNGAFDPQSFRDISGLSADDDGGFVAYDGETESVTRRWVHVDRGGEVVNQWYGGQRFFQKAEPDPEDPTRVWLSTGHGLALTEVDYDAGSWTLLEEYDLEDVKERSGETIPSGFGRPENHWRPFHRDGETYLVGQTPPQILRHDEGELVPIVRGSFRPPGDDITEVVGSAADGAGSWLWTDGNGDGRMQADEMETSPWRTNRYDGPAGFSVLDDGSLLATRYVHGDPGHQGLFEYPVEGWTDGVPQYDLAGERDPTAHEIATVDTDERSNLSGAGAPGTWRDSDGNDYAVWGATGADSHGIGTFPGRTSKARLTKWDADGNERWTIGKAWHMTQVDPRKEKRARGDYPRGLNVASPPLGVLHAPAGLLGTTHGSLVVADRSWLPAQAWTKDGLYAGYVLDTHVDDKCPEWVYHWWRSPEGDEALLNPDCYHKGAMVERENGEVIWFAPGRNSTPVYRIRGWDDWQRTEGTATLGSEPTSASADGSGLQGAYFDSANADLGGSPTSTRVDDQVWFAYRTRFDDVDQWNEGVDTLDGQATDFAVRWTGELEAKLSEPTVFSVYGRGDFRLQVDGETVVDAWERDGGRLPSEPIELEAGERYPIRLDFRTTAEKPHVSLNWDSFTQERERIPTPYLYPGP